MPAPPGKYGPDQHFNSEALSIMAAKYVVTAALALFAGSTCAQGLEVPAIPGEQPRTPVVWATMDAFDLERTKLRTGKPLVAFDAEFLRQKESRQQAQLDRLRIRLAEQRRETPQAGQPDGDATIGPGRRGASPATGSQ
jgi:hypothetical protein